MEANRAEIMIGQNIPSMTPEVFTIVPQRPSRFPTSMTFFEVR